VWLGDEEGLGDPAELADPQHPRNSRRATPRRVTRGRERDLRHIHHNARREHRQDEQSAVVYRPDRRQAPADTAVIAAALLLKQVTYPHVQSSLVSNDLPAH